MEDKEINIDFAFIFSLISKSRSLMLLFGFLFALTSAIVVFNKPNIYLSTASIMPEYQVSGVPNGLGKFAGLANLAGININDMAGSDAVRPDLYPSIINNTSFFLYLLKQKVKTREGKEITFEEFYLNAFQIKNDNKSELGVIDRLKHFFGFKNNEVLVPLEKSNKDIIVIRKGTGKTIENLIEKITAGMDKKTGIISISVELPDPLVAAQVAQITTNYLTDFVTNYRTEKVKLDLDFLSRRLIEAKSRYFNSQEKKALYSDKFSEPTIRLKSADIQRERIDSDYKVSSNFYQELLKEYETAKLKVQKETPVFKILQKPIVPYEKIGPSRLKTILIFCIIGLCFGLFVGYVKTRILLNNQKHIQ
jgi:uncharacterized protein involved in exopolysaccharide biosynthesis